jgi:hypothetical protein
MFIVVSVLIEALEDCLSDYPIFQGTILVPSYSAMFRTLINFSRVLFYDSVSI